MSLMCCAVRFEAGERRAERELGDDSPACGRAAGWIIGRRGGVDDAGAYSTRRAVNAVAQFAEYPRGSRHSRAHDNGFPLRSTFPEVPSLRCTLSDCMPTTSSVSVGSLTPRPVASSGKLKFGSRSRTLLFVHTLSLRAQSQ